MRGWDKAWWERLSLLLDRALELEADYVEGTRIDRFAAERRLGIDARLGLFQQSPTPSGTRTRTSSSIAISSRRTCWWTLGGRRSCSTSASRRCSTAKRRARRR